MRCEDCRYEWKSRKQIHKYGWHCPQCGRLIKDKCPACGNSKIIDAQYCNKCSCKIHPRKRPSRLGIPTKNGFYIISKKESRTKYKMVLCPDHPRAKRRGNYVPEHILVWEREHNKYLPDGYTVHHRNGNGLDNKPKNLIALKRHGPWILYHIACKRIRKLEELLSQQRLL